ncbi:MAG: hypothetical protein ACJAXX_003277 [Roseivirga sp.]
MSSEPSEKGLKLQKIGIGRLVILRWLVGEERQQGRDGIIISGYFFGVKTVATVLA